MVSNNELGNQQGLHKVRGAPLHQRWLENTLATSMLAQTSFCLWHLRLNSLHPFSSSGPSLSPWSQCIYLRFLINSRLGHFIWQRKMSKETSKTLQDVSTLTWRVQSTKFCLLYNKQIVLVTKYLHLAVEFQSWRTMLLIVVFLLVTYKYTTIQNS